MTTASSVPCSVFLVYIVFISAVTAEKTNFVYREFPYKETGKNEIVYREFESACDKSETCANRKGLERVKCIRECISPSCYHDIYYEDSLEDGEIDVRLNSFKGCFVQRTGRQR